MGKGAAEIAERDQDHVPEVKVLTTLGMFAVPCTAETTIGEIRQKVQEWKPEDSLEQIELVCKDKDAWGPLFNKTSRPRDDAGCPLDQRCSKSQSATTGVSRGIPSDSPTLSSCSRTRAMPSMGGTSSTVCFPGIQSQTCKTK